MDFNVLSAAQGRLWTNSQREREREREREVQTDKRTDGRTERNGIGLYRTFCPWVREACRERGVQTDKRTDSQREMELDLY